MKFYKHLLSFILVFNALVSFVSSVAHAQNRSSRVRQSESTSKISLGATHLLPSVFVIPGGQLILGSSIGYGFFDVFDITSNLFLDLSSVFNVQGKFSVYRDEDFGIAVYVGYSSQQTKVYDSATGQTNKDQSSTAVEPGATVSYRLLDNLTAHTGLSQTIRNPEIKKADVQAYKNGFLHGTMLSQEFTAGIARNFALSIGGSYDLVYEISGAGASIHIGGFQLGAHYYFNVQTGSVLPILGGSYSTTLN
jgi:hypothetical protein